MMRYLLDTNIISNATKPLPSQPLTEWMAKQVDDDLFICSLSLAEIYRGILEKPSGKKRRELEEWFKGPEGPQALFRGRVLTFDEGGTHLGTSHVPGHARRATEECSQHGRCGDRGGERLRSRYGQREALSWREPPQSAPLGVISGLTAGSNGMKTAQRATLSYEKTWWPGTELNRRRQPFQGCIHPSLSSCSPYLYRRSYPHFGRIYWTLYWPNNQTQCGYRSSPGF
jgi:hypothetical protein